MLSQTAEYALRAVASLAPSTGQLIPTTDLAKLADVPPPYLAKVLQQLSAAGIIRGRRGVGGGYTLNRSPEEINLLEVVLAVGPLREPKSRQQIEALGDGLTNLHALIDGSVAELRNRLERTTVASVAQQHVETKPTQAPAAGRRDNGAAHARSNGTPNGSYSHSNGAMASTGTY